MSTINTIGGLQANLSITATVQDDNVVPTIGVDTIPELPPDVTNSFSVGGSLTDFIFATTNINDTPMSDLISASATSAKESVKNAASDLFSNVHAFFGNIWDQHSGTNGSIPHELSLVQSDKTNITNSIQALQAALSSAITLSVEGSMKKVQDAYGLTTNEGSLLALTNGDTELFSVQSTQVLIDPIPLVEDVMNVVDGSDSLGTGSSWDNLASDNLKNLMNLVLDTKPDAESVTDLSGISGGSAVEKRDEFLSYLIPSYVITFQIGYDGIFETSTSREVTASELTVGTLASNSITPESYDDGATRDLTVNLVDNTNIPGVSINGSKSVTGTRSVDVGTYTLTITDPGLSLTFTDSDMEGDFTVSEGLVENIGDITPNIGSIPYNSEGNVLTADITNNKTDSSLRTNTFTFINLDSSTTATGTYRLDYTSGFTPNS